MSKFSPEQLAEIVQYYFEGGSYAEARRTYKDAHKLESISDCPSRKVIRRCVKNFKNSGVISSKSKTRKNPKRTTENIEMIKSAVEEDPEISIRKIAKRFNLGHSTVHGILRKDLKVKPQPRIRSRKQGNPSSSAASSGDTVKHKDAEEAK